ncbi:S-methyl-5-thioribose-1-phosphate isomerase [Sesbania bispinosa]|nr:S-methyl-5-thioribose-1-phosphate isomerase [Sesbania bispinosa]
MYDGCCGIGTMGKDTGTPLWCCLVAVTAGLHGEDGGGANLRQRRERLGKAHLSSGDADDVQLPPAMTLCLVRAEARGNGGLRRAITFDGTTEGETNLGRAIEQQRSGRLRPWLHEGTVKEREISAMAAR